MDSAAAAAEASQFGQLNHDCHSTTAFNTTQHNVPNLVFTNEQIFVQLDELDKISQA